MGASDIVAKPHMNSHGSAQLVIDVHAHLMVPEVYAATSAHSLFVKSFADATMSEAAKNNAEQRTAYVLRSMSDVNDRLAIMDAMGVDVQVLSSSLVHQCSYWAAPAESLRLERMFNDRLAQVVRDNPRRFIGLGGVPLHAPAMAAAELVRCMSELGLAGVGISTMAGHMEIGDAQLRPFWAKAEELGAVISIHPAGNTDPRFQKFHLWNSIGQNFEEAMAIASIMYEGILDAFPALKICISHGGGYMPLALGRIARNYLEKPSTRANMRKSPAEYLRMLYYDTCVYEPEVLAHLVERVGADRVILGSDYPVGEMKPVEFVNSAPLSEADKQKIIASNGTALFGHSVLD
jgi:aminocarboxymuconate-semialdehyde decarboxylase